MGARYRRRRKKKTKAREGLGRGESAVIIRCDGNDDDDRTAAADDDDDEADKMTGRGTEPPPLSAQRLISPAHVERPDRAAS